MIIFGFNVLVLALQDLRYVWNIGNLILVNSVARFF